MLPATWMTIIAMCADMKTTAGKGDQERREAQHKRTDRLRVANVSFHQPVVKQVQPLHDEQSHVGIRRSEYVRNHGLHNDVD